MEPLTIGLIAFVVVVLGGALLQGALSLVRGCLGITILVLLILWLAPKVIGG